MPKIIELTVEIEIQRVSCPGVWLCQDGRVSLTVFALGTSYQTCLLPPIFPLMFKDVFYFRKRFQETCALNNMCCLLKDETIFCELVQWCEDCNSGECTILAQYLGALTDVLFPPNMCSTDGVDLLMRRSKEFPGILSPKIEIATKVRIDEVWNTGCHISQLKTTPCQCAADIDALRQRQVCHTPQYHRNKCNAASRQPRPRSRSSGSRSCVSLREPDLNSSCKCPNPITTSHCRRSSARPRSAGRARPCTTYNVYTTTTGDAAWSGSREDEMEFDEEAPCDNPPRPVSPLPPRPPVSSRPPQTARRDRAAEFHGLSAEKREHNTLPEHNQKPQHSVPIRGRISTQRERSTPRKEHSSPLHERRTTLQKRSTSLKEHSSPLQASSKTTQQECNIPLRERSSPFQQRSSATRQRATTKTTQEHQYRIYNVDTGDMPVWIRGLARDDCDDDKRLSLEKRHSPINDRDRYQKIQLESRYIEDSSDRLKIDTYKRIDKPKLKPCICEICKRYHELFHSESEYAKC